MSTKPFFVRLCVDRRPLLVETFFGHLGTGGESFEEGAGGAGQLFIVGLLVLGVRCACADLVD